MILDREEYIEQAYFFRVFRERLDTQLATQEILINIHEEILSTTRLPFAVQFLATEIKHTGLLSTGFAKLPHYFSAFQSYVIQQTEKEGNRFSIDLALLILEREAEYRADKVTPPGLFVYQFEAISRNRLGYVQGLASMRDDPFYDESWKLYLDMVRRQVGVYDFADLVYLRSTYYVVEQQRLNQDYQPPVAPLFGEKEGKIAKANRGREPLFLFAALQRQLGYPEVPRPKPPSDLSSKLETMKAKMRQLEARIKLVESEIRGQLDLSSFINKQDFPPDPPT